MMLTMTTDTVSVTEVVPGLHRIELGFVNAYVLENDGDLTLLDAGFFDDAPLILEALATLGHEPGDLKRIVLTHGHIDHLGAAADLRERTGARILLSKVDADRAAEGWTGHKAMEVQKGFEELVAGQLTDEDYARKSHGADSSKPIPITPFQVDAHLVAGQAVAGIEGSELIATPGHCAGQLSILLKQGGGILIAGDAAVNFGGPPAIAPVAEDLALAQASFDTLRTYDFETVVFGHGDPIVGGASAAFRDA